MSSSRVECLCCYDDAKRDQTITCNKDSSHIFCFDCIYKHIKSLLQNESVNLSCISTGNCTGKFSHKDLDKILNSNDLEHFYKVEQRIQVRSALGNNLVSCPFCSLQMISDDTNNEDYLLCPDDNCGGLSCKKCFKGYHSPNPCNIGDYNRIQKEEKDTYEVIKSCPSCNVDILRTDGCTHMTCTRCGTIMCYTCGEDISKDMWGHACKVFDNPNNELEELVDIHREQYIQQNNNTYEPVNNNYYNNYNINQDYHNNNILDTNNHYYTLEEYRNSYEAWRRGEYNLDDLLYIQNHLSPNDRQQLVYTDHNY